MLIIVAAAFAFEISPVALTLQDVPVGKIFYIETPLSIQLGDGESLSGFVISSVLPKKSEMIDGYEAIPDTAFFGVECDRPVFIGDSDSSTFRLFTRIPDDPRMFNRRFLVKLRVSPIGKSGEFLEYAATGFYPIETEANRFMQPDAFPIATAPSNIDLDENGDGVIAIFNNDTVSHFVICYPAVPDIDPKNLNAAVRLTPGCRIGDPVQFVPSESSFVIEPGGKFDLGISMPNEEYRNSVGQRVEVFLWIKDPSIPENTQFARMRWSP